jgi:hypothetical protein
MNQLKRHIVYWMVLSSLICCPAVTYCQEHEFNVGLRFQKAVHLYWENGITADYTHPHLWQKRIHLGFSYCTSRLGTAYHSNAIKQDNYLMYCLLNFREEKLWQPVVKLNTGYFYSDMEYKIFEMLPHESALVSLEAGVSIKLKYPIRLSTSLGYNFITGNGMSGPGTLYPVFYQLSLQYVFNL